MSKIATVATALCVTAISGCGHMGPELDGYHDGWRRATVKAVLTVDTVVSKGMIDDCRSAFGAQAAQMKFAWATYPYGGSATLKQDRIVAVPEGFAVHVGDHVAINTRDCAQPLKALTNTP
jgi:hypothetical protein